ncbi:alanine:cation symporter family protein [Flavobacterium zhairuonense]|uniref:hypothetical protein n=1 Tax=Flavobacterium zhairuonense TaxID=2493631 RepID=UPI0010450E4D|nr:hypothetical protein [Flavobacterium zhairuonense]KAF2509323.1 alanine:cation symporter family protein [Flavobacterium zhairuonense]
MNFSNLKWYLFAVITVFLCFYLIPETQYNSSGWAIGIVTSLLVAFFIFLGIAGISSLSELSYFNSENPNAGNPLMYIVPIATFLFGSIIINSNFSARLEKKIKKEGVFGTATIDSGFSETTESSRSGSHTEYTLSLTFTSADNKVNKVVTDISSEAYRKVGVGLEVEIIYLPQNPQIFRVLVDDESIKNFKNISNRSLEFKDLEKFITAKDAANLEKSLKQISGGWKPQESEIGGFGFINNLKKELVLVHPANKMLLYIHNKDFVVGNFKIPKEQVIKELKDSTGIQYETDKYYIKTHSKYGEGNTMTMTVIENVTMQLK